MGVAIDVANGPEVTCVRTAGGYVWCYPSSRGFALAATEALTLANGDYSGCAGTPTGTACWQYHRNIPSRKSSLNFGAPVDSLTLFESRACGVLHGKLECWSIGGALRTEMHVPEGPVTLVAQTSSQLCAVVRESQIYCTENVPWYFDNLKAISFRKVAATPRPIRFLALGNTHGCITLAPTLDNLTEVQCWGDNRYGQLGINGIRSAPEPVSTFRIKAETTSLAAGEHHACLSTVDRKVMCWGQNDALQASGDVFTEKPFLVKGLPSATQVAVGRFHSCAILRDHSVRCWGANSEGQLGELSQGPASYAPVPFTNETRRVSKLALGDQFTCLLLAAGNVHCTGAFSAGSDGLIPMHRVNLSEIQGKVRDLVSGRNHAYALLDGGQVACWGSNEYGQVKSRHSFKDSLLQIELAFMFAEHQAEALFAGGDHTCAQAGTIVECWGKIVQPPWFGVTDGRYEPRKVSLEILDDTPTRLHLGAYYSCATLKKNGIWCWGNDGRPKERSAVLSPGPLAESRSRWGAVKTDTVTPYQPKGAIRMVALGEERSCLLLASGQVECWTAQIHDISGQHQPAKKLSGWPALKSLSGFAQHFCGVDSRGRVICWGNNAWGQVGSGPGHLPHYVKGYGQ